MSDENFNLHAFITSQLNPSALPLLFDNYAAMNGLPDQTRPAFPLNSNSLGDVPATNLNVGEVPQFHYSTNTLHSTQSVQSSLPQPLPDLFKLVEIVRGSLQGFSPPSPAPNSRFISEDAFKRRCPLHAKLMPKINTLAVSRALFDLELAWLKDTSPTAVLQKMSQIIYDAVRVVSDLEVLKGRTAHLQESSTESLSCLTTTADNSF
jgi:hypothetical protein